MNPLIRYIRGTAKIHVTGIGTEELLNRLSEQNIRFWGLMRQSDIELECIVFVLSIKPVQQLARKHGFDVEVLARKGLVKELSALKRRPVFAVGFLLCVAAVAILPMFVWTISISGNSRVQTEEIRRAIDDFGVRFGTYGADIDSQLIKMRIMNRIPELRWCAVNRSGGCVKVMVAERDPEVEDEQPESTITNVVASRDGVIVSMEILQGFRRCKIGDAVQEGDLLVSGMESHNKTTQLVHAYGEIYALTNRETVCVLPLQTMQKSYTGQTETRYSLIIGRKRIKISRNSGIPQSSCDKITERSQIVLPGEHSFPVWLETETYVFYEPALMDVERETAQKLLRAYADASVRRSMIAGQVLTAQSKLTSKSGCWVLQTNYSCREMIARTVPATITESETQDG